MTAGPAALDFCNRFGLILAGLRRDLAARAARDRALAALVLVLWNRLSRLSARFTALMARHRPATPKPRQKPAPRPGRPPPPRDSLPRCRGWLLRHVPECAAHAECLRVLLAEPEMAALIEQTPQMRRLLRPLWRMLHPEPPPDILRSPAPAEATLRKTILRKTTLRKNAPGKPRCRRGGGRPLPAHRGLRALLGCGPPSLKRG